MSYQNRPSYVEPYIDQAEERLEKIRTHQVELFVSGTPKQQQSATEWIVDYLTELDIEKYRRNKFLAKFRMALSTREEKALGLAIELFPDLQSQPREETALALGVAATKNHCFWELLCIGFQGYYLSADCFYLSADAIRHAISHWDTPTAVVYLKQALKPIDAPIDYVAGLTALSLISELSSHPALRQLVPELKALERHAALKESSQKLRSEIHALAPMSLPVPAQPHDNLEQTLPIPTVPREKNNG